MKSLKYILCTVAAAVLFNTSVYAADALISAGSVQAGAGSSVSVPVTISDNPGICSLGFEVEYDSSVMTLTGVDCGEAFDAGDITEGDLSKVPYTVSASRLSDTNTNGLLVTLNFTLEPGSTAGEYEIKLASGRLGGAINIDEAEVGLTYINGKITVVSGPTGGGTVVLPSLYGDVDLDGKITSNDSAIILQKALNSSFKMPIEIAAAEGKL